MPPLGPKLSFCGRVDNFPNHLLKMTILFSLHPHPPSSLSLPLLSLTYHHSISAVPVVPHLCRHNFPTPSTPAFLFFHPHHIVSLPPSWPSPPRVSSAVLVTSVSIIPVLLLNIFLPGSYFPLCSPCSTLISLIYFSLSNLL